VEGGDGIGNNIFRTQQILGQRVSVLSFFLCQQEFPHTASTSGKIELSVCRASQDMIVAFLIYR